MHNDLGGQLWFAQVALAKYLARWSADTLPKPTDRCGAHSLSFWAESDRSGSVEFYALVLRVLYSLTPVMLQFDRRDVEGGYPVLVMSCGAVCVV